MVTSDNFDIFPVCKQDVLFRTFDNLIGFSKKNKKKKFTPALKEEYNPKTGEFDPNYSEKAEREKRAQEQLAKIKKVRNLDKNPIRKTPLKQDTEYSVGEMSKYIYANNPKVSGKWEDAKAFESSLRASKKLRDNANTYMIKKLGHKNKTEVKVEKTSTSDLVRKAFESKIPQVKELVKDFQNPTAFRNALEHNSEWKTQLEKLLNNSLNEEYDVYELTPADKDIIKRRLEELVNIKKEEKDFKAIKEILSVVQKIK